MVWPVVDTVIWGSLGLYVTRQGGAVRSGLPYMLAGILLMHVLYQSNISVSTGFMEETWSRNIVNFLVTPIREREYLAGLVLVALVKLAAGLTVVTVTAAGFYAFNLLDIGWSLVPIVAVLMLVGFCMSLFVIGLVLRFGNGAEIFAWGVLFIVVALSGAFYPVDALPAALQPMSRLLPSTHAFEAARAVLDGRPLPLSELGWSLVGLVVVIPASVLFVGHMLGAFRRRGYITRYL